MTRVPDDLANARASAKLADKYVGRAGTPTAAAPQKLEAQKKAERQMLENALTHVRRGIGKGIDGQAATIFLKRIEEVLVRDYGLYQTIKPDRDPG